MVEYIERQAAIDAFWKVDSENDGSDGCTVVYLNKHYSSNEIESIVSDIPAASVREDVHSKWEWFENWTDSTPDGTRECTDAGWRCGKCGYALDELGIYFDDPDRPPQLSFCPDCGARMVGGGEK